MQCKQTPITNSSLRNEDNFYINRPVLGPLGHAALHHFWDAEKGSNLSFSAAFKNFPPLPGQLSNSRDFPPASEANAVTAKMMIVMGMQMSKVI